MQMTTKYGIIDAFLARYLSLAFHILYLYVQEGTIKSFAANLIICDCLVLEMRYLLSPGSDKQRTVNIVDLSVSQQNTRLQ